MRLLIQYMNWPLRAKLVALLVVASLLPLAIATGISLVEVRQRMVTNGAELLAARGDQLLQRLDTFHFAYRRSAGRLASLPEIVEFCGNRDVLQTDAASKIRNLLQIWTASDSQIRGIAILDSEGKIVGGTESQLIGLSTAHRKYVQECLDGKSVISDIHLAEDEVGEKPTIAYLAPVVGGHGWVIGAVCISVRASAFWDVMKASNELAGPGSFAVLFDRQGIRIAHTNNDSIIFHPGGELDYDEIESIVAESRFGENSRALLADIQPAPEQFGKARAETVDRGVFKSTSSSNRGGTFTVARRFESVPWTVFYMIPEESIDALIWEMSREKALFAIVIIVLALGSGTLFAAVILKPINSLAKATEAIASGDLSARVPAGHSDELGRLEASFNLMAERLQAQAQALQSSRNELELRVQHRTAELSTATKDLQAEIVERKLAEQSLHKSQTQLETIVDNLDEGVIVSDLSGKVMHFNRAALEIHGFTTREDSARPMIELAGTFELSAMDGTVWTPDQWPLARALRGEKLHELEVRIRRFHSDWERVFAYGATLVRDEDGGAMMAIVTISDITERKRAEEEVHQLNADLERRVSERTAELQAMNSELEAFSYSVSHDLRAPLRSLDGFSQALLEDSGDKLDEEGKDNLQRIRNASQRMGHLIDDLLNLSRLTRVEMNREPVDLSAIAREVAAELSARSPEREVEFVIGDGLMAQVDPRLMRIALENLLSNAWKFTANQKETRIEFGSIEIDGNQAFFVRDNGVGFDMAYAGKLFRAFQRLHAMNEFPGTGIGLTIVQRIVQRHGGRVWAQGTLNVGATFFFVLPRSSESHEGVPKAAA